MMSSPSQEEAAFLRAIAEVAAEVTESRRRPRTSSSRARSFEAALEIFAAACPADRVVREHFRAREETVYAAVGAGGWPDAPPTPTIHLQAAESLALFGLEESFATPRATLTRCLAACDVESCDVEGMSVGGEGWRIVVAKLATDRHGDDPSTVDRRAVFAAWCVDEGDACLVAQVGQRDAVARMIGLPAWPTEGWEPFVARVGSPVSPGR